MPDEAEISWRVHSHQEKEHSVDWYWALGLIALTGAAVSVWLGNALFALIIILASLSLGILVARGPREHEVSVGSRGVSVDGTLYPFRSLQSFWITKEAEPRLLVTTKGIIAPHLSLRLEDSLRAEQVKKILKHHLEEEEQEPHFGEHLAELFGL